MGEAKWGAHQTARSAALVLMARDALDWSRPAMAWRARLARAHPASRPTAHAPSPVLDALAERAEMGRWVERKARALRFAGAWEHATEGIYLELDRDARALFEALRENPQAKFRLVSLQSRALWEAALLDAARLCGS